MKASLSVFPIQTGEFKTQTVLLVTIYHQSGPSDHLSELVLNTDKVTTTCDFNIHVDVERDLVAFYYYYSQLAFQDI